MSFVTRERWLKRRATLLKKALRRRGRDVSHTDCLNLMSRIYKYADYVSFLQAEGREELSPLDCDLDHDELEARFAFQEEVMAEAGFGDIAGAVLDEVQPTDHVYRCDDDEAA